MTTNSLVLQCGGPTAVVNSSLAGVIAARQRTGAFGTLWGCRLGLQGLVHGDWVELTDLSSVQLDRLRMQPGAALGSGRYRMQASELPALLQRLQEHGVGALFIIGGNGSMAAGHAIGQAAAAAGYIVDGQPLAVVGIPKTIDNDLVGTYVAPGYGSAARFIAQTVRDIGLDLRAMRNYDDVVVLEVMGRHTGWLAAAGALARQVADDPPHLILLPEAPLDEGAFLARVHQVHAAQDVCLVVASEGARAAGGAFLAEAGGPALADASGQKMLSLAAGVAPYLAGLIRRELGLLCRQLRPDTIQRASSGLASAVDRDLAELVGTAAVEHAQGGAQDVMIGVDRQGDGWQAVAVPLADVLGRERVVPQSYIDETRFDVTPAFVEYARSVVGELSLARILL